MTHEELNQFKHEFMSNFAKIAGLALSAMVLAWSAMFWATRAQSKELISTSEERISIKLGDLAGGLNDFEKQYGIDKVSNDARDKRLEEILKQLANTSQQQQQIIRELSDNDREKTRDIKDTAEDVAEIKRNVHGLSTQLGQLKSKIDKVINQ